MNSLRRGWWTGLWWLLLVACCGHVGAQTSTDAQIREGIALHGQRNFDGAIQIYRRILETEPSNSVALYELAFSLSAKGDCKTAVEVGTRGVATSANDPFKAKFLILVGSCEDRLGNPQAGAMTLKKAVELDRSNFLAHFNLGVTYARLNQFDASVDSLQSAIAAEPGHASSHYSLSRVMHAQGKLAPSLLALLRYWSLEPTGARASGELGRLDALFAAGVERSADGKKTIKVNPKTMEDSPVWTVLELGIALTEANAASDTDVARDPGALRAQKLEKMLQLIGEQARTKEAINDVTMKLYFPFFAGLSEKGLEQPMAYRMLISGSSDAVRKWVASHPTEWAALGQWLRTQATRASVPVQN
jgi:tetratricopeptide (TPR) repeat protein